jgi:hypothetical protein
MRFFEHVLTKPRLYTGSTTLASILIFLGGYILALRHYDKDNSLIDEWWSFISWLIEDLELDPIRSWHTGVLNRLGDSEEGLMAFGVLYARFLASEMRE